MKPPKEMTAECPICQSVTAHIVLGGRIEGKKRLVMRSSVKCTVCGHVHPIEVVEESPIEVPIIISWMEESDRSVLSLLPSEEIQVGEEIYLEGERIVITSIESGDHRLSSAKASEISTIWAKKFNKVKIKISLDLRGRVLSKKLLAVPEEEFIIGDIFEIDGRDAVITSIRTANRTIRKGAVAAGDIIRIYAKGIRV